MPPVADWCRKLADRIDEVPFVAVEDVYQPSDYVCVVDFVDRQFPRHVVGERAYGYWRSSVSYDKKAGVVEFNINKYVPPDRSGAEFYLPDSVCGSRIHAYWDDKDVRASFRLGVQGAVDTVDDAIKLIYQFFQPL